MQLTPSLKMVSSMLNAVATLSFCLNAISWTLPIPDSNGTQAHVNFTVPYGTYGTGGYEDIEGPHLEGDILVLKRSIEVREMVEFNGLWPDGIVPYVIADGIFNQTELSYISAALNDIQNSTCIRFIKPRDTDKNYIRITRNGSVCSSFVGLVKLGAQDLNLGPDCLNGKGTAIHELLHALGFYHEHTRFDRDNYIDLNLDNIKKEALGANFDLRLKDNLTASFLYDYDSILHYHAYAFAIDPKILTIKPKVNVTIGQRKKLSDLDIKKAKALYNCK